MCKELSEMTLEELWELFPIILRKHKSDYYKWYDEVKKDLLAAIGEDKVFRINHIGSSAVEGLICKPTVDILLEVKKSTNIDEIVSVVSKSGWGLMNSSDEPNIRRDMNKGYTKYGFEEKVFHLHIMKPGDWNELYFRDYLKDNKKIAQEYANLKLSLLERYKNDRDGYTNAKTDFIRKHSILAKSEYGGRYFVD